MAPGDGFDLRPFLLGSFTFFVIDLLWLSRQHSLPTYLIALTATTLLWTNRTSTFLHSHTSTKLHSFRFSLPHTLPPFLVFSRFFLRLYIPGGRYRDYSPPFFFLRPTLPRQIWASPPSFSKTKPPRAKASTFPNDKQITAGRACLREERPDRKLKQARC